MTPPFDLLVECGGCGLENLISDYSPGMPAICNQCRENMMSYNLVEPHQGHVCESCQRVLLLKKETDFVNGESECQCGGQDFTEMNLKDFTDEVSRAEKEVIDDADDDPDFDWCRPAPDPVVNEDYNEIFDDDPGFR
ncbi:MAG: hypothetical protein F3745_03560 [Nitrospinae bacterium]|nr:hypothetical protein [Nitrospinota bacterium]